VPFIQWSIGEHFDSTADTMPKAPSIFFRASRDCIVNLSQVKHFAEDKFLIRRSLMEVARRLDSY
jgi:DNA-binding LytR/AlgR family response regulator